MSHDASHDVSLPLTTSLRLINGHFYTFLITSNLVEEKRKGLCTSAGNFVALSPSIARVTSQKRLDSPNHYEAQKVEQQGLGWNFGEITYVYAMYFWHSECVSPRTEELLETMWRSMIGVRYSWTFECDANIQPEVMS